MTLARTSCLALLASSLVLAGPAACGNKKAKFDNSNVTLEVDPSNTSAVVGDTVTVSAQTTNTVGRQPRVDWDAPGALRMERIEQGRAVRVRYNEPGTYTVRATMKLDDGTTRRDSTTITVRSVP